MPQLCVLNWAPRYPDFSVPRMIFVGLSELSRPAKELRTADKTIHHGVSISQLTDSFGDECKKKTNPFHFELTFSLREITFKIPISTSYL